ncbi:MAG: NDP-sugar synthase [Salinibacter sp.]
MDAYLLCAGFGTRMRPLTEDTPKPLLSVGGRPLLDHLLTDLRDASSLEAIHLVANHRTVEAFRAWAAERRAALRDAGVAIRVYDDGGEGPETQLGAVGDLRFLLDRTGIPEDGALVSGGDSLYRFPLAPLLDRFDGPASRVLALHEPDPARRRQSSVLRLDGPRVTGLAEDPADADSTRICPSWYLLTTSALTAVGPYLDEGGDPDTLGAFVDAVARTQRVEAVRLPEQPHLRLHCNTPADLERARTLLEEEARHVLDAEAVRDGLPERDG